MRLIPLKNTTEVGKWAARHIVNRITDCGASICSGPADRWNTDGSL